MKELKLSSLSVSRVSVSLGGIVWFGWRGELDFSTLRLGDEETHRFDYFLAAVWAVLVRHLVGTVRTDQQMQTRLEDHRARVLLADLAFERVCEETFYPV